MSGRCVMGEARCVGDTDERCSLQAGLQHYTHYNTPSAYKKTYQQQCTSSPIAKLWTIRLYISPSPKILFMWSNIEHYREVWRKAHQISRLGIAHTVIYVPAGVSLPGVRAGGTGCCSTRWTGLAGWLAGCWLAQPAWPGCHTNGQSWENRQQGRSGQSRTLHWAAELSQATTRRIWGIVITTTWDEWEEAGSQCEI